MRLNIWFIDPPAPPTMREITEDVALAHNLTVEDLLGPRRLRPLVRARWEAWTRIRAITWQDGRTRHSLPRIGRYFNRDHATVLHGLRSHAKAHGRRAG